MNAVQYKSTMIVIGFLLILGEIGEKFFSLVEENFFHWESNWLLPVYQAFGHLSISMTTFFSIWVFSSVGLLAVCAAIIFLHRQQKWYVKYLLYGVVLASALAFTLYRSHQMTYLHINDNSVIDMEMSWIGALAYLVPLTWATKRRSQSTDV